MDRTGTAVRSLSAGDTRAAADVGRRARLEASFAGRHGRTTLTHAYAEPPLRIGCPIERAGCLHLIMASSAPGLFGGDTVEQSVVVGPGARVHLRSQSAMQIHPAVNGGAAMVRARYSVAASAELRCSWDPIIPFREASFDQQIDLDVERGGRLTWSDGLMSGREGSGERWAFRAVAHQLRLRHEGRLVYVERYRLAPVADAVDPWLTRGCTYFGTIVRIGFRDRPALAEAIHTQLAAMPQVRGSSDLIEDDDLLLVRMAADSGVPFHRARAAVERLLF